MRGQLQSLSPLAVLQRGYALVMDERGAVVRSVTQLIPDQAVQTRLGDGSFASRVTSTAVNQKKSSKTTKDKSSKS
jgi:exodeoxyribonuclease VII large subunit